MVPSDGVVTVIDNLKIYEISSELEVNYIYPKNKSAKRKNFQFDDTYLSRSEADYVRDLTSGNVQYFSVPNRTDNVKVPQEEVINFSPVIPPEPTGPDTFKDVYDIAVPNNTLKYYSNRYATLNLTVVHKNVSDFNPLSSKKFTVTVNTQALFHTTADFVIKRYFPTVNGYKFVGHITGFLATYLQHYSVRVEVEWTVPAWLGGLKVDNQTTVGLGVSITMGQNAISWQIPRHLSEQVSVLESKEGFTNLISSWESLCIGGSESDV